MRHPSSPAYVLMFGVITLAFQGCGRKAGDGLMQHPVRKVPAAIPLATPKARPENFAEAVARARQEREQAVTKAAKGF